MANLYAKRTRGSRPQRRRGRNTQLWLQTLSVSTGPDARGHGSRTFQDGDLCWAYVRQLTGEEIQFAREIAPRATHEVEIDYSTACTPRARFRVHGSTSRVLHIVNVNNVEERNREQVCLCREELTT